MGGIGFKPYVAYIPKEVYQVYSIRMSMAKL
jgi:hypothetical protein